MRPSREGKVLEEVNVPVGSKAGGLNWIQCIASDADGNIQVGDIMGARSQRLGLKK